MAFEIKLNGNLIMVDTTEVNRKDERESLASLLTTKSTDSGSAQKAAETLGGLAWVEMLESIPADSTVEVYEKPEGKTDWKIRARYTVAAIAKRVTAASTQAERQGEIFQYDETKTAKPESTAKKTVMGLV